LLDVVDLVTLQITPTRHARTYSWLIPISTLYYTPNFNYPFSLNNKYHISITDLDPPIPILLLDDDEDYVSMMKMILEDEGFSVDYAYNGREGLVKLVPGKHAVVITDYVMPMMRGDEVAKEIRELDKEVGLILLTGFKSSLSSETLKKFNYVLEKPTSPAEVLTALRSLVGSVPMLINVRNATA
jgi:two-component system response regulator VicR